MIVAFVADTILVIALIDAIRFVNVVEKTRVIALVIESVADKMLVIFALHFANVVDFESVDFEMIVAFVAEKILVIALIDAIHFVNVVEKTLVIVLVIESVGDEMIVAFVADKILVIALIDAVHFANVVGNKM